MDLDNENFKELRTANPAIKCDNCSCRLKNDEVAKLKNSILDTEVQIWDALAFIYGVSWSSIENYKSEKITEFLKTPDDLRLCSTCACLLNDNYNSHLKFEDSSDASSVVQLVKEFRDYKITSTEKRGYAEMLSDDLVDRDIKVDMYDDQDFLLEDLDEDSFQPGELVETKYEPPSTFSDNFSDQSNSSIISEQIQSPSLSVASLKSKRCLVKSTTTSPEDTRARNKRILRRKPKKRLAVKNLENDQKFTDSSPPEDEISNVAQNLQKRRKKKKAVAYKKTGRPAATPVVNEDLSFDEKVKLVMEKYADKSECSKIIVNDLFVCLVCEKGFKDFDYLKYYHWPTHQVNNPYICVCDICGRSLKKRNIKWHKIRAHGTEEEKNNWRTKCDLCEAIIFSFDVARHNLSKHNGLPQEKCNQCEKVFLSKRTLKAHLVLHSSSNTEKCDLCDKVVSVTYMRSHLKNIHGDRERTFCCEICPHKSYTKESLDNHRLSHTDLRPYVCEECGKSFKYNSHSLFRKHMKCHREIAEKGEWAFTCSLCEGKTFKHSLALKQHMKRIHRQGDKKFECSVCSKQLFSKVGLTAHENMHKENPGFVPRTRNKVPRYIEAQISSDNNPTVESTKKSLPHTEAIDFIATMN